MAAPAETPLPPHIALRVALAARELRGVDNACLLRELIALLGEPLGEARLARLRLARLRRSLEARLEGDEGERERQLQRAIGLLKGRGVQMPSVPLPALEDALPVDAVRIACASDEGERLDGRFSSCARFLIYQVTPCAVRLVALREAAHLRDGDARLARRAELVADCQLLYALSIGGPAAARVIRAGVHPIQVGSPQAAREAAQSLCRLLGSTPPPWLAKALGAGPAQRVRFVHAEEVELPGAPPALQVRPRRARGEE